MSGTGPGSAFIITAQLPTDLARWATHLRTRHFPPDRNFLSAHVTLFHALPPSSAGEVKRTLGEIAGVTPPINARLEGVMALGRGTALRLKSPDMMVLRDNLADRFYGLLTPQDQQRAHLHITIQNKVKPQEARALQTELAPKIEPRDFRFHGLSLHIYRGGPWEFVRTYAFRG